MDTITTKKLTAKEKDILKFLEALKIIDIFKKMTCLIFQSLGVLSPQGAEEFCSTIVTEESLNGLLIKYVPLYSKVYTHKEIKELLKFFSSPIGQMYIEKNKEIALSSDMIGSQWAQALILKHADDIERIAEKDSKRLLDANLDDMDIKD
jgi:hypothetical protein